MSFKMINSWLNTTIKTPTKQLSILLILRHSYYALSIDPLQLLGRKTCLQTHTRTAEGQNLFPKKKFSFPQHPQNIEETFRITHTTIYVDYVRVVGIAKVCILQKQLLSNEVIDTVEISLLSPPVRCFRVLLLSQEMWKQGPRKVGGLRRPTFYWPKSTSRVGLTHGGKVLIGL